MSKAADGFFFKCDPAKNTECKKTECFMHGGQCTLTRHMKYAMDPSKVTMVIPTDGKTIGKDDDSSNDVND